MKTTENCLYSIGTFQDGRLINVEDEKYLFFTPEECTPIIQKMYAEQSGDNNTLQNMHVEDLQSFLSDETMEDREPNLFQYRYTFAPVDMPNYCHL